MAFHYIVSAILTAASLLSAGPFDILTGPQSISSKANRLSRDGYRTLQTGDDWVIGETDPNETVNVSGNYYLDGNLIIVNNGVLNVTDANFRIKGDIYLFGTLN
ncbi:MAG: hypothetical protein U5R06_03410 [candidate division KSB1 bacterium]|nr:hypothetical protein [candidate division KSB1 bacterium]